MTTTLATARNNVSLSRVGAWLACFAVFTLAGCAARPPAPAVSANHGWTKDEVSDSYVFGYPLVLMTSARAAASAPGGPGVNKLRYSRTPPAADDPGLPPRPDVDTLASSGWLDLSNEPVLLALPATRGQYLDARVLDMWTNVVWSTGSLENARGALAKPRTIAFVAPGWQGGLPDGVERVEAPGKSLWLAVRVAATGPRELAAARRLQEEVRVTPLSAFDAEDNGRHRVRRVKGTKRGKPLNDVSADRADDDPPSFDDTPAGQSAAVASLDANAFFGRLADALQDNPPSPNDPHALEILADLGVKPGEPLHLPTGAAQAIAGGLAEARARIATAPNNALSVNGWIWLGEGLGHYDDDYALRAYAAYAQPGSGTKDDEVVATATLDADGKGLDGSNRYVLHFPAKGLPPVRAFWTLTAYTLDGALVEGDFRRRSIASRDALHRNRDGSLDVYVQAETPGRARQANWLPTPDGAFEVVMRLYAPQGPAIDGTWQPPALERQ
jgi:hypothetical protein